MGNEASIGKNSDLEQMKKYANFSPGQVEIIREKFDLVADEDQTISKEQFGQLMKIPAKEVEKVFDRFDTDSSGRIDAYEFISALALLSQATLARKAELIFKLYDFDRNKTITPNELVICLKTTMSSLNAMSGKEEMTIQQAEIKTKDLLQKYDTNKDGSISLPEFQSFISKDQDIVRSLMSYGLISKEDMRADFGGANFDEMPDADSDLEEETSKNTIDRDERIERIKNGIEHSYINDEEKSNYEKQLAADKLAFKEQKHWQTIIQKTVHPNEAVIKYDNSSPPVNLSIHHVYGFRCYDTRNNIKVNLEKDIIFHTAALGIVQKPGGGEQSFYQEHTDDITSMDIAGNIAVTGQLGTNPLICVWDTTTLESKAIFKGFLKEGISHVAISQDQKRIAAVSLENDKVVVIYDLEKQLQQKQGSVKRGGDNLLATGRIGSKSIFDMKFDKTSKTVIVACKNEILFISFENNQLKTIKGLWSSNNPPQSCLCIGIVENTIISGMFKGHLYLWKNAKFHSAIPAHNGPITAIHTREGDKKGIITAGRDGQIIIWDGTFKNSIKIDTKDFKLLSLKITAISEDLNQDTLVFGTRSSEIVEVNLINNRHKVVMNGHWNGELWGLTTLPNSSTFYTVGEENFLACWNGDKCSLISSVRLDFPARCIDISLTGKYIAVGCLNGTVLIIDPKSLVVLYTVKEREQTVTCIRFSPDGDLLLVAYQEPSSEILGYDAKQQFKPCLKIRGSNSAITHIDFSNDNKKIIQCNNSGSEILYFDLIEKNKTGSVGKQIIDYKQIHGIKWRTQTCIYSFNSQGIWPPYSNGGDINSVDLSTQHNIIVSGDDFSKIKAFRYPCTNENQAYNRYNGHASHVSKVRFLANDTYVVSTGGAEKSIIQWKFEFDHASQEFQSESSMNDKKEENAFEEEQVDRGDQIGATKPYQGQLLSSIPDRFKGVEDKSFNVLPNSSLNLAHIFGFKCKNQNDDARNLLKFLPNGRFVYPAAGVGIVSDTKKEQSFFIKHDEDIVSLAVHPKGNIVATGQMAAKGKSNLIDIFVWDAETKQILGHLNDFHLRAVSCLEFSPDGQFLLSVGEDNDHSLAIHDWQQSRLVATSKIDKSPVTAVIWRNNSEFVTAGTKHIKFWNIAGRNINAKSGTGMNPFTAVTCLGISNSANPSILSGTADGRIFIWNGNSCSKAINAHPKGVGSFVGQPQKQGIKETIAFSAGYEGRILKWKIENGNLTQDTSFILDLASTANRLDHGIISLSIDSKAEYFLIGTRNAEIYLGKIGQVPDKIMDSHFEGEVWGCASDPTPKKTSTRFATSGGDKTIRLWDIAQRKMLACTDSLPNDVRAIDWSLSGQLIVAGDSQGQILLFNSELEKLASQTSKFTKLASANKKLLPWIEDIKISPNERFVAFGAHGGPSTIEIFEIKDLGNGGKSLDHFASINAGLTSALTHLDWNDSSDKLIVNSQAYELKYLSVTQKKDIPASTCSEEEWATWTCTLGWYSKGIFQGVDGTDVNTCSRSNNRRILVSGDDFGRINLYSYPACVPKQTHHQYIGHSSHITRVKFTSDDQYVLTTGGNDRSIFVWKTENLLGPEPKKEINRVEEDISEEDLGVLVKKERRTGPTKFGKQAKVAVIKEESDDIFGQENIDKGDEFMAVKPWLGAIKEPSSYYKDPLNQQKEPPVSIELDYVHGYRSKDCRDNIRYLKSGQIVYHAAGVGIVMDIATNTQRFFKSHSDDITAMDVHPDGVRVATGQVGAKPAIFVWDSNTLLPVCQFKGNLKNGICALAFSPSGDKLAAIAIDTNHEIAIYDINAKSKSGGVQILLEKTGPDVIIALKWKTETEFASIGVKHFKLWQLSVNTLKGTKGSWDKHQCSNILLSINVFADDYVCGAADGSLQVFKGSSLTSFRKVHEKAIDTIFVSASGFIFTGSKDTKILVLDRNYNVITKVLLEDLLRGNPTLVSQCPEVRALSLSADQKSIVIGTFGSEIYELSTRDAKITATTKFATPKSIVKGHYAPNKKWTNEVWGLSMSPMNDDTFFTCSDDGTLRSWSISQKKQEKCIKTNLDQSNIETPLNSETQDLADSIKGRCIAVSSDGTVAVGFKDGTLRTFDGNLSQLNCVKPAKEWISDVKFSPDGTVLAVGSHDNAIYVHSVSNGLKQKVKPLRKHSSYITHLDFSRDGNNLHSNCGAYELLFWDANNGKQITSGATQFRDEVWATWTTTLGWPVQGIWPEGADGTDINAVDRSNSTYSGSDSPPDNYYLLATGDDESQVKLFRYPCIKKGSKPLIAKGHSSHVTNVKFSKSDEYLISTGGEDNCIFQWKITKQK